MTVFAIPRGVIAGSTLFLATLVQAPAHADLQPQYLPSASQVSYTLRDSSVWGKELFNYAPLGSKPRGCKSTTPFNSAEQSISARYGPMEWLPSRMPSANVNIYEFLTSDDATTAVTRAASLADSCRQSTEWWCRQCDGVITYWRRAVAPPMVGEQATSWVGRAAEISLSRYRTVVARKGSSVVAVTVWTSNSPGGRKLRYPRFNPPPGITAQLAADVLAAVP